MNSATSKQTPVSAVVVGNSGLAEAPVHEQGLTPTQWLVCAIAALGFAFDLHEITILPLVLRPALADLANLKLGSAEFSVWISLFFYLPAVSGGVFGLMGGYLTDVFGRRRVLVWSILLYALSTCAAGFCTTLPQLLFFRCTTLIGICVEYVAAVAWVAELFSDPKKRESALGYTQTAAGFGGLLGTGAYYVAITYAERLPAIHGVHEAWRYTLLSGLFPAIPLMLIRPWLPESPLWRKKSSHRTSAQPSILELFHPSFRRTTLVTSFSVACVFAIAYGVLQQMPRIVPGLPSVHALAAHEIEQTVSRVQLIQEFGSISGRLLLAVLVVSVVSQQRLLRMLLVPGLFVFSFTYFFAARHTLLLLQCGIFLAALLMNAWVSLWWNYLPRVYPTRLRGTGESFAENVGGRMIGTVGAVITIQLSNILPGSTPSARLAHAGGYVAVVVFAMALAASWCLAEPESGQLPD